MELPGNVRHADLYAVYAVISRGQLTKAELRVAMPWVEDFDGIVSDLIITKHILCSGRDYLDESVLPVVCDIDTLAVIDSIPPPWAPNDEWERAHAVWEASRPDYVSVVYSIP